MPTETLRPDAGQTLTLSELSGTWEDIDDDPDSPDTNWLTATSNGVNVTARTTLASPTGAPTVGAGLQEFRVQVRQFDTGQSGNPTARIELWENGVLVRAGSDVSVTGSGQVIAFTWNANELATADGSLVECNVVGTKAGGSPSKRNAVEVGAIEWNADYSEGGITGTLGETQDDQVSSASGHLSYVGTTAATQDDQTATGTGNLKYLGSLAETQENQIATASGTFTGSSITGSLAETQDDQVATAAGHLSYLGSVAETQENQIAAASGTLIYSGGLAATQDEQMATGTGHLSYVGVLAETQDEQTAIGSGVFSVPITGTLAIIQDDQIPTIIGEFIPLVTAGESVGAPSALWGTAADVLRKR